MDTDWALPIMNLVLCTACGDCAAACPEQVLVMRSDKPVFQNPENCTFCAVCESVCPEGAVRCELEIGWENSASK